MGIIGLDVGTMNLVSAKQLSDKKTSIEKIRNMFIKLNPEDIDDTQLRSTNWDFVEETDSDGKVLNFFVFGEDSYNLANLLGKEVLRPMQNGVLSTSEIDSRSVLTLMVKNKLIGTGTKGDICVFSSPAQAVDVEIPPVSFHEECWSDILSELGYKAEPLNEARAIIFSECADSNFSGIAISFGCGLTNVSACYKGTPVLQFSIARGGDWIDHNAAITTNTAIITRITKIKEKDLNLLNPTSKNKKEKLIKDALVHYHKALIKYVIEVFKEQFQEASGNFELDESIPIVISGGTSMPAGFIEIFQRVFEETEDFPYEISEIRRAKDPLNAVALGSLTYGIWKHGKKENKKESKETKEEKVD